MAQFARPATDISDGGWTTDTGGTALAAAISETVASDVEYIQSSSALAADVTEIALGPITDPNLSTGHVVRYRIGADTTDHRHDVTVQLMQGATEIAVWTHQDVGTALTTYAQTLTGPQADAITNYGDLRLRITSALRPRNNWVSAVGDSITLASAAVTGGRITSTVGGFAFNYGRMQAQLASAAPTGGYLTWAAILPKTGDTAGNGKLLWGGVHATVNFRTDQILATHILGDDSPLNATSKCGICLVMAGSNDLPQICPSGTIVQAELDQAVADIGSMYDALIAGGILPVALLVPPSNTPNYKIALAALNPAITSLAVSKGVPVIDTNTPVSDGANGWGAGMHQGDGIHPSVLGAKNMGQVVRDGLDSLLPNAFPVLSVPATDDAANMLYKNGSFTDDGNADGVPDGGQVQSATYWNQTPNGTAWSLAPRAGFDGKALRWNKTTDPGSSQLQSTGAGTAVPLLVDGHLIQWGFKCEIASWSALTQLQFQNWKMADAGISPFRLNLTTDSGFTSPIAPFIWYQEWTVPTGYDDLDGGKTRTNINAAGTGTNTIDAYIGQFTLRDGSV